MGQFHFDSTWEYQIQLYNEHAQFENDTLYSIGLTYDYMNMNACHVIIILMRQL